MKFRKLGEPGQPPSRLGSLVDRVGELVEADPAFDDADRIIVLASNVRERSAAAALCGYPLDDDREALGDMLGHAGALAEINGLKLQVETERPNGGPRHG
jgi:hypothetical protein